MFTSGILDVAIGIVFVYLLVSLIVTAANEIIAALFRMRGRVLWEGLCNLLPKEAGKSDVARQISEHPLISGLSHGQRPSYIPSRTFALALLDAVSGGTGKIPSLNELEARIDQQGPVLRRQLRLLLGESEGSLERFKANIEVWFNNSMDRVGGVYKRRVQYALFVLSFLLAAWLNVDTIVLANRLSHDSALRAALISQAEAAAKAPLPAQAAGKDISGKQEALIAGTIRQLSELSLPIGWDGPDAELRLPFKELGWWRGFVDLIQRHFVGWALTAFAGTLGAPFWFDLLNRFINIRSAGKAPEERPRDPKEVPVPAEPGGHQNSESKKHSPEE